MINKIMPWELRLIKVNTITRKNSLKVAAYLMHVK